MQRHKAIIFDRDGTLIVDKHYLNDPQLIEYYPGVFQALRNLRDAGFIFAVATNQSGIPRGIVTPTNLSDIHNKIRGDFSRQGVDFLDFYYAPFMTHSGHHMRKPNAGMLEVAARNHHLDLSQSWMIGDKMSDVESGHRAGCKSVLLTTTNEPPHPSWKEAEIVADSLLEASHQILHFE